MKFGTIVESDRDKRRLNAMLVGSSGGHLLPLHRLKPWWENLDRAWIAFNKADRRSLLVSEDVKGRVTTAPVGHRAAIADALRRFEEIGDDLMIRERPSCTI